MSWSFVVVYLLLGAVYTSVVGRGDGKAPFKAEIGLAGGILAGVCWPFALVYITAYGWGLKERTPLGEQAPGVKP